MIMRFIYLASLALCLASCNGVNVKQQVQSLDTAITEYNTGLRWGIYNNLDAFNRSEDGGSNLVDRDAMKNIRITGNEILEKHLNSDATEALVKGEISYYNNEYGTLKKVPYEQKWWYDTESKHWFVEGSLPEFK